MEPVLIDNVLFTPRDIANGSVFMASEFMGFDLVAIQHPSGWSAAAVLDANDDRDEVILHVNKAPSLESAARQLMEVIATGKYEKPITVISGEGK